MIPFSYEYLGYAATHENMLNPEGGDGNQGVNPWDRDVFISQEGGGNAAINYWTLDGDSIKWQIYNDGLGNPSKVDADIPMPNGTFYRLREGIERFMITDINNPAGSANAQSEIRVMWDMAHQFLAFGGNLDGVASFNHVPGGANVLYMDGHTEFMKYPGKFPMVAIWVYRP